MNTTTKKKDIIVFENLANNPVLGYYFEGDNQIEITLKDVLGFVGFTKKSIKENIEE